MMSARASIGSLSPAVWAGRPEAPTAAVETSDSTSKDLVVLFDRYSGLVLGTAYRVLGDPSEAEEVVQEVFLYVYRKS